MNVKVLILLTLIFLNIIKLYKVGNNLEFSSYKNKQALSALITILNNILIRLIWLSVTTVKHV